MKRINTSGRLAGQRGGNVVHHLDLRSGSRRRKQRPGSARVRRDPLESEGGPSEDVRALEADASAEQAGGPGGSVDPRARRQIHLLERRLRKVTSLLGQQGEERSSERRFEDLGVASMFREVQGIDREDAQAEHKKTLMESIFRENLRLQGSATFGSSRPL